MVFRPFGTKALSEPVLTYYHGTYFNEMLLEIWKFLFKEMHSKMQMAAIFVSASMC